MNVKRGQKLCKHCNNVCGARSKVCKHCNKEFEVRTDPNVRMKRIRNKAAKKSLIEITEWKKLQPGQNIYFNGRSGAYWLNGDGTKDYTTDKGVYRIVQVMDKGFGAYGRKGYTFFDMTNNRSTISSMLYNSPYKIYIKKDSKFAQNL